MNTIEHLNADQTASEYSAVENSDEALAWVDADHRLDGPVAGKPSLSVEQAAANLIRGAQWAGHVQGEALNLTYAFRASAPAVMPRDLAGFSSLTADQIQMAEEALAGWSDVANITFERIKDDGSEYSNSADATILIGGYNQGAAGEGAFAYGPGAGAANGDLWFNTTPGANRGVATLTHEFGHAIGILHPGSYGINATYANDAAYYEDSRQYSIMSYFGERNTGAEFRGLYASAPMLDDIAAAQLSYGANMNTRTGNTTYGFNSNADRDLFQLTASTDRAIFAVWDAGGIDTFDFSGYGYNQTIDLREGHFSSVGGLLGNVSIAMGVDIENAKGGWAADLIYGNDIANTIRGNGGNDTIYGFGGNDFVGAGAGNDIVYGGDGNDTLYGEGGDDQLNGEAGSDIVYGGSGADTIHGNDGNDTLKGDDGNDQIFGDAGSDSIYGGAGDDDLDGGSGTDVLEGGDGDDVLAGGAGSDTLTGGAGGDTFYLKVGAQREYVTDFNAAEGDHIQIAPGQAHTTYQSSEGAVVSLGGGDYVILAGVQLSSLSAGWLIEV